MIISIVTINLNNNEGLSKTIASIKPLHKECNIKFEHILIDGDSTDGSVSVIRDYSKKYKNVRYVSEKDGGVFDAMNKAVDMALGTYILFINSGDEIVNHTWLNTLSEKVDVFVYSTVFKYPKHEKLRPPRTPLNFFWGLPFCHQSSLVKKSLLKKVKFNTESLYADYEFFMQIKDSASIKIHKTPLARYEVGGISDITTFKKLADFLSIHRRYWGVKTNILRLYLTIRVIKKQLMG